MSSNDDVVSLVAEYKSKAASLTELEKANFEERVSQAATLARTRKSGEDRNEFLTKILGVQRYDATNRQGLRGRGPKVDPLWERVQRDSMPVTTAVQLARKAESIAFNRHMDFSVALTEVLEEYDAKPGLMALPTGKFLKRAGNRKRGEIKTSVPQLLPPPPSIDISAIPVAKNSRDVWRVIRQMMESTLRERMRGCDPIFMETLVRDFSVDLYALVETYQGRINRMGSNMRGENLIPSGKEMSVVNDACRALNLEEIEVIGDILDIIRARKNAKAFLAKFHPDKNPGSDQDLFKRKYQDVVNALGVIEEYNDKHGVQHVRNHV